MCSQVETQGVGVNAYDETKVLLCHHRFDLFDEL